MLARNGYRVNFEVTTLKPFSYLAFPHFLAPENTLKQPSFDGELMASSDSPATRCDLWTEFEIHYQR